MGCRSYLLLLWLILTFGSGASVESWAQEPATLSGYVVDATSGETLIGANVLLEGTGKGAATNTSGYFVLPQVEPGTYVLRVSYLGYDAYREEITLVEGEHRVLTIELRPAEVEIGEVVVTAEEAEREARSVGVSRLSTQLVRELPAVLEPDVFRSLQLLPGIQAASDFSSGLYIRGGGPDQTLILLDRTTVYNPSHFFGFFSTFNPDAIKDVQVYKGGYPAEYGGRLGSVVDIYNKDGNRRSSEGGLSLGMLASRAYVEGPIPNGSFMVAARRSTLEPLLAVLNTTDVEGIPDRFYFYDVNAKLNLDPSRRDRVSLSLYLGQDVLRLPFLDDAAFDVIYGNRTVSGTWRRILSPRTFATLTGTASRYFSDPRAEIGGTDFYQRNRVEDVSVKGDLEWAAADRHTVQAGFWIGLLRLQLRNRFQDDVTFEERIAAGFVEAYAQDTFQPHRRWQIRLGARASYFARGNYVRLAPRLQVEYQATEGLRLQSGYGRYHQFLTLETNEALSAFDQWLTSDAGVPPASGDQVVAGVKVALGAAIRLDVEGYYRTMDGLFKLNPFLPDRAGLDYADVFIFGDGFAYGTEVLVEKSEGRLNGFVAYTLGLTRRRFSEINDGQYYPPKHDRTHDLNIVANFDVTPHWRLTGVFSYATGQAYTPAVGQYRLVNEPLLGGGNGVIQSRFNSGRLPSYHRLDVGVTRRGRFFGLADYEAQIQVINAYGRRNVWFYFFNVDTREEPTQEEIPQIPIPLPNVSFSLRF